MQKAVFPIQSHADITKAMFEKWLVRVNRMMVVEDREVF